MTEEVSGTILTSEEEYVVWLPKGTTLISLVRDIQNNETITVTLDSPRTDVAFFCSHIIGCHVHDKD